MDKMMHPCALTWLPKLAINTLCLYIKKSLILNNINILCFYPAPTAAGAAPPKNQATAKRGVLYMPQQPCRFSNTFFFALPSGVPVSNCFIGPLRAPTKNSLEDRMSKFHLVKKWWDLENRDFAV